MELINLNNHPELFDKAAQWFSSKWNIPSSEYKASMEDSLKHTIPNWYIVTEKNQIIAGAGIIENDFHERKDLTPNICALYVEKSYRNKGIAGKILNYIIQDMINKNITPLYLITDHTSFYEKYNWKYICDVKTDDNTMSRMHVYENTKENKNE